MATYSGKYNWVPSDTVRETDMNRIEIGIRDAYTDIAALTTIIGSDSSGLQKRIKDLETTVGNASSGLVKKTTDLETNLATVSGVASGANTKVDSLTAIALTSNTKRKLFVSSTEPSGAVNGDIWLKL